MKIIYDNGREQEIDKEIFKRLVHLCALSLSDMKDKERKMFPKTDEHLLNLAIAIESTIDLIDMKAAYQRGELS